MSSDSGKHRYYDDDDDDDEDEDDDDDVIDDDDDDDVAGGQEDRMVTLQACHANDSCSKVSARVKGQINLHVARQLK